VVKVDELIKNCAAFTKGRTSHDVTFLPEPERRHRHFPLISVDDHFIEAANMFEARFPAALQDRAPRIVEQTNGDQVWMFEDRQEAHTGLNAVVGRPLEECGMEPTRFDAMRKGTWDPAARVHDMDINGVYASLNFPSALPGLRRPASAARRGRRGTRHGDRPGVELLGARGVDPAVPRALHSVPDPVVARPAGCG
jgi:hypothetical protein